MAVAMRGLGYSCQALPPPDLNSYETGKEYQNNAYCNPAYFTIGNLVKYLQELEAAGMSRREIVERYVFVTVGTSCGTCRFGITQSDGFESLGVPFRNLVFSDYTSEKLYREGGKRASIDPCFPSKLGIPHVHNLTT